LSITAARTSSTLQLELSTLKKPYEKAGIDENGAKDVDMRI